MKQFEYQAQCEGGGAISGVLEATDGAEAMRQLELMNLRNVDLRETRQAPQRRPITNDDFIFFNEQLASLASAGICLDAGLRQLGRDIRSSRLRTALHAIAEKVERGQPLDQALEQHTHQMPALYARVVRAGVANGQLPATLLNLSHHLRLVSETRRLIAEAVTYPLAVLVLALGVLCGIMVFVVPQFAEAYADFGVRLPGLTVAMLALARAMPTVLAIVALVALGLAVLLFLLRFSPGGRALGERAILAVPLIGPMLRNSLRARFLRAMAFAVGSGLPLPEALRLSAGATASAALGKEADLAADHIEQGMGAYEACKSGRLIPAMLGYVVELCSERGDLRDTLMRLSTMYDANARRGQSAVRSWMAPAAIVCVGFVIGILILALFMPMVNLLRSVSG